MIIVVIAMLLGESEVSPLMIILRISLQIAASLLGLWLGMGYIIQAFKMIKDEKPTVKDLFSANWSMIGQSFGVQMIIFLVFTTGILLIG